VIPMHLRAWRESLPLRKPFVISAGTTQAAESLFVALEEGGLVGFGEAAPSFRVTGETVEGVRAFLHGLGPRFQHRDAGDWAGDLEDLHRAAPHNPAAKAALDLALLDLAGKELGKSVRDLLGLKAATMPTSATVVLAEPEAMAAEARSHVAAGFRNLKLKLGEAEADEARVRAVRDAVPEAKLRVDANGAWTGQQARDLLEPLHKLEVELVEQPLPRGWWEETQRLTKAAEMPILVDEDVLTLEDVRVLAERRYADGFVLKLMKCGGLWQGKRMLDLARGAGIKVQLGCMVESSLGISAASHLLDLVDWADLDGAWLLARDPWRGARIVDGVVEPPEGPGLGAVAAVSPGQ